MHLRACALLAFVIAWPVAAQEATAHSQQRATEGGAPALDPCWPAGDPGRLLVALDPKVLDVLDRLDQSLFVHAYLVGLVAEPSSGGHWTSRCARALLAVPLDSAGALVTLQARARSLPTATLLAEIRAAAERRAAQADLARRAQRGAVAVVTGLLDRLSIPEVAAAAPVLQRLQETCGDHSAWCGGLDSAQDTMGHLLQDDARLDADRRRLDQLVVCVAEAAEPLTSDPSVLADSSGTPSPLTSRVPCPAFRPDTLAPLADLQREAEALRRSVEVRESALVARLRALRVQLESLGDEAPPADPQGAGVPAFVATGEVRLVSAQAAQLTPSAALPAPAAGATVDLVGAFADVVIERARDESVLYLISRLYRWMRDDTTGILPAAFPETDRLFRALARVQPGSVPPARIRVREAAQVPLSAWRAALADDYGTLPFHLAAGASPALCARDPDGSCAESLRGLQVALAAFQDLLRGAPALDVVERLPRYAGLAPSSATSPPTPPSPQWQAARAGLAVAAALAQAYRTQRAVSDADAARYPYLLSADALAGATAQHRSAFVRLLLLRAAPALQAGEGTVSERGLAQGVEDATAALGHLAALLRSAPADPEDRARATLRAVSDAFTTGADLAAALRPALAEPLQALRDQWGQAGRVAEAVAAGDHGLALTRTLTLVDRAAPGRLPVPVLRLSALASELAGAETEDQARAAFRAAASPLGGWEAKRFGDGARFTLTAYPGGGAWHEWLPAAAEADGTTLGVALPIGPEITLWSGAAPGARCFVVCSVGLFVPILDLGALLSYRLDGGGTPDPAGAPVVGVEPNVSFAQVLSPGLYLSLGLFRSPASLLVGAQLTPELRDLSVDGRTERASAFRLGAALTLDLVLLEF